MPPMGTAHEVLEQLIFTFIISSLIDKMLLNTIFSKPQNSDSRYLSVYSSLSKTAFTWQAQRQNVTQENPTDRTLCSDIQINILITFILRIKHVYRFSVCTFILYNYSLIYPQYDLCFLFIYIVHLPFMCLYATGLKL